MHDAPGSNREWLIRVAIATLCLAVHGCDSVRGGAVELSWKLRPASSDQPAKFVDCDSGLPGTRPVTKIQLHWQSVDVAGAPERTQSWDCNDNQGVTGFDLDVGPATLWVTPLCDGDQPADPATYIAPAKLQRQVNLGDTVSLSAVELVVSVSNCQYDPTLSVNAPRQPCICCAGVGCAGAQ